MRGRGTILLISLGFTRPSPDNDHGEYLVRSNHGVRVCYYDCSKVPPLRNCIIRNSGLILLNKTPLSKKPSRSVHTQFLLKGT